MTRRFLHNAPWLSSVSRCLGPTQRHDPVSSSIGGQPHQLIAQRTPITASSQNVEIVERIPIPDELVPADAQVEIAAKKAAGYFTPDGMPQDQASTRAVGRPFDKSER
jgi:hypothetical protein